MGLFRKVWSPALAGIAAVFVAGSTQSAALPMEAYGARVDAVIAKYADAPPQLRVLLQRMPKGGDLHNHLDGSVYAEDYLKWASDDGFCVHKTTRALTPPPCTADQVSAHDLVTRDPKFYQETIDALSMRNWYPGSGTGEASGHDHTFATFARFIPVGARHLGDMLAVTREIAARDNVTYIEQMTDPQGAFAPELLGKEYPFSTTDMDANYAAIAGELPRLVGLAKDEYDAAEMTMRQRLGCLTAKPMPKACAVDVRYLFYVVRTLPPRLVFAQIALGFALVKADPRFVGVDFVAPEDDPVSLRDFKLHMAMFAYFKNRDPQVQLSLHAGELALGLVPPTELGHHIADTVRIAGARRIGHGYSIPYETDAANLLAEMARNRIAVEINLTSNDITPGIKGKEHPLAMYRAAGVPVSLSADDEGVFRIDLTHEYVRAVTEQKLRYLTLKELARNGLEYSFLRGASLWQNGDYRTLAVSCKGILPGTPTASASCHAFLMANEKAAIQWKLEGDFFTYESWVLSTAFAR